MQKIRTAKKYLYIKIIAKLEKQSWQFLFMFLFLLKCCYVYWISAMFFDKCRQVYWHFATYIQFQACFLQNTDLCILNFYDVYLVSTIYFPKCWHNNLISHMNINLLPYTRSSIFCLGIPKSRARNKERHSCKLRQVRL